MGKKQRFYGFTAAVAFGQQRFSFSWLSRSLLAERNSMWGQGSPRGSAFVFFLIWSWRAGVSFPLEQPLLCFFFLLTVLNIF